jgi:hypothetical protein
MPGQPQQLPPGHPYAAAAAAAQQAAAQQAAAAAAQAAAAAATAAAQRGTGTDICAEVTINDAPGAARFALTQRKTQDEICRRTHAQIVTRGRYIQGKEAAAAAQAGSNAAEKPLFLRVTPGAGAGQVIGWLMFRLFGLVWAPCFGWLVCFVLCVAWVLVAFLLFVYVHSWSHVWGS